MPQTPKAKQPIDPANVEADDEASWGEDQKARSYYYDDAHGYETYDPDADDELADEDRD